MTTTAEDLLRLRATEEIARQDRDMGDGDHPSGLLWAALKTQTPIANVVAIDIAESSDHIAYALLSQYRGAGIKPIVARDLFQFPIGSSLPQCTRDIVERALPLVSYSPLLNVVDISGGRAEHLRAVAREAAGRLGPIMGYKITSAYAEPSMRLDRENALWLNPDRPKDGLVQVCSAGRTPLLTALKILSEQALQAEVPSEVPLILLNRAGNHAGIAESQLAGLELDTTPSGREVISTRGHDDLAIALALGVDACRWVSVLQPRRPKAALAAGGPSSSPGWA